MKDTRKALSVANKLCRDLADRLRAKLGGREHLTHDELEEVVVASFEQIAAEIDDLKAVVARLTARLDSRHA